MITITTPKQKSGRYKYRFNWYQGQQLCQFLESGGTFANQKEAITRAKLFSRVWFKSATTITY